MICALLCILASLAGAALVVLYVNDWRWPL